jgi:hypothetical protein
VITHILPLRRREHRENQKTDIPLRPGGLCPPPRLCGAKKARQNTTRIAVGNHQTLTPIRL